MSFGTVLLVFIVALIIFLITFYLLRQGRIPVKFAILWLFVSIVLFIVCLLPNLLVMLAQYMGFQTMSNMVIGILIFILFMMSIALTVIVSGQKSRITLLIQEISILKKELEEKNGK